MTYEATIVLLMFVEGVAVGGAFGFALGYRIGVKDGKR
jgi:hypothetical protein